ncbi:type II toxin-antitoxin system Phd/YefM family antitoxin [Sporolactobacillus inulinus]|uniref:Antitoxin n=1 Tax=Sporolactobacillus inulinus CASD TaxID=1069536 RepID=A0A0U1QP47_9BACL|nr:type II toxin-antitoxin system Phd/YefM family antitoxin [Sporolactobacillus inulinus]KLI02545.1 antitoxin PHD [Sporolactobacillus inulinus CASD]GEB78169.1 prevent-host-death protein [Sporolactobacillus inulinus]
MPEIRPSSDLRNKYNEIAQFCHEHSEPVYLTKNGKGDLAVMSIDTYEMLTGRFELYNLLAKGEEAIKKGKSIPADEAFKRIEDGLSE